MDTKQVADLAHCDRLLTSLATKRAAWLTAGWRRAVGDANFLIGALLDRRLALMRLLA